MIVNSQIHLPFHLHSSKICISTHTNRCFRNKIHSWWFPLFHLPKIQGFLWILNIIDENINLIDMLDFPFPPPLYPIHPFDPLAQPLNPHPSSAPLIVTALVQSNDISHKEYYPALLQSLLLPLLFPKIHPSQSRQVNFDHVTICPLKSFNVFHHTGVKWKLQAYEPHIIWPTS